MLQGRGDVDQYNQVKDPELDRYPGSSRWPSVPHMGLCYHQMLPAGYEDGGWRASQGVKAAFRS